MVGKKTKKGGQGRRGMYHDWITDEGLLKIEGWARDGLTDKQIAHNIGVTERTITRWKKDHPSIMSALKKGKEVIDRQVENALLKRALGYEYEETTYETGFDGELRVERVVKKQVQPDTTAQIFWLKNRKPIEWRDRQQIEHSGQVDINQRAKQIEDYLNENDN